MLFVVLSGIVGAGATFFALRPCRAFAVWPMHPRGSASQIRSFASWARSCRICFNCRCHHHFPNEVTIERSIAYTVGIEIQGHQTSAPSHQVYRRCALWRGSELFQRLALPGEASQSV
jgi:hypothetical protein